MRGWLVASWLVAGCAGDGEKDADADQADADADADSDTDSDSDTDTDAEPGPDADQDGSPDDLDCDDTNPAIYPGAPDVCGDELVTDCDRTSDDGLVTIDGTTSYPELQQALDAAPAGSELLVCPGTHVGPFVAPVAVDLVSFAGNVATILDGAFAGPTVSLAGDSAITGFTITNGRTNANGGGISLVSAGVLTVTGCVVSGNEAVLGGGIATGPDSYPRLEATTVRLNTAVQGGGGIYVGSGSAISLTSSTVENNTADFGGGVCLDGASLVGGLVSGNVALSTGAFGVLGGMGIFATGGAVVGTEVAGNTGSHGAIAGWHGSLLLTDVSVHDNLADAAGALGGGIYVYEADVTLEGTTEIWANHAWSGGGGFVQSGNLHGGVIRDNVAEFGGGGIALEHGDLTQTVVASNLAAYGGGVWVRAGDCYVNGTYTGNVATISGGGVASGLSGFTPYATLTGEFTDNEAATAGGAILVDSGQIEVNGSLVLRNQAASSGGAAVVGAATLMSQSSEWGSGADDNVPSDVLDISGYHTADTFYCDALACDPMP